MDRREFVAGLAGALGLVLAGPVCAQQTFAATEPDWAPAMREVHARFRGRAGTFAQFGDSITFSDRFWAWLREPPRTMDPATDAAFHLVHRYQRPECWDQWKGPDFGNDSGATLAWALENIDDWLLKLNPETVVLMFGTNDLGSTSPDDYEANYRPLIERCLTNGSVVILTTIPPKHNAEEQAGDFASVVRRLAKEYQLPLVDFHSEILARRTDDWDGALEKFRDHPGDEYQAPTLIARDGVHPSNPEGTLDFSEPSLQVNGYALRTYLTLHAYADVIRRVHQAKAAWYASETVWLVGVAIAAGGVVLWRRFAPRPAAAVKPRRRKKSPSAAAEKPPDSEARSEPAAAVPATPIPPPPVVVSARLQLLPPADSPASFLPSTGLNIDRFPFQIGRRPNRLESQKAHPDLVLDDRQPYQLSRAHVGFYLTPEGDVLLRDLGSQLGVIVDGQLVGADAVRSEQVLSPGEHLIVLGNPDSRFRFRAIVNAGG